LPEYFTKYDHIPRDSVSGGALKYYPTSFRQECY